MLGTVTLDSSLFYGLAALCLVLVVVAGVRWTRERRVTVRDVTRAQRAQLRDEEQIHQSLEELLQQLEDVSRRINAQAEAQLAKLGALIRAADERIARLEAGGPAASRPAPSANATPPPLPSTAPVSWIAPDFTAAPAAPALISAGVAPAAATREQRKSRVYELADAGTPAMTIADTLQMPLGEVELLLNLREFK